MFKYARVVKQKVWNEAENRERDGEETLKIRPRPTQARALCARKTLTPRFTGFLTDFEKKNDCFSVYDNYTCQVWTVFKKNDERYLKELYQL